MRRHTAAMGITFIAVALAVGGCSHNHKKSLKQESFPGPSVITCKELVSPESPLVDSSGNGGHITSCKGTNGHGYTVPWYHGFPTASQLNGSTAPTATTCLPAVATGLGHDSYGVVTYAQRSAPSSAPYRWVPTRTTWSARTCT